MEPILQTTQDERAQCLADMADTEYGTLKNYDVCFGFDWRKWEELASPEEFVRWAKSRANHALMPPNARGVSYEP